MTPDALFPGVARLSATLESMMQDKKEFHQPVSFQCWNTIIGSGNGLSPGRHQTIIWTNAGILLIRILGTNLSEIHTFSFKKMHLKLSSAKWRLFCLGLYELNSTRHGLSRHDPNHSSYPCHFRYQPVLSVAAWPLVRIRSMPNLRSWERTGGNGRGPRGPRGPLGCTTAPGWAVKVPGSGITLGCKRSAMKNEVLLRASL